MDNEKGVCTFMWSIENHNYFRHLNKGESFDSPMFIAEFLEGTVWYLKLKQLERLILLAICGSSKDEGPEGCPLEYELSVLAADGFTLECREGKFEFKKKSTFIWGLYLETNDKKIESSTLTVCCKMWKAEEKENTILPKTQIYARTHIGVEHMSFRLVTENFSALKPNEKSIVCFTIPPKNTFDISCELHLCTCPCCPEKIMVEIKTSNKKCRFSKLKICLVDVSGKEVDCGEVDVRGKDNRILPLSLTKQHILNKKSEYLPDDNLSLLCQCSFYMGVEFEKIERVVLETPFVASRKVSTKKLPVLKYFFVAVFACFFGVCVSYLSENVSIPFSVW